MNERPIECIRHHFGLIKGLLFNLFSQQDVLNGRKQPVSLRKETVVPVSNMVHEVVNAKEPRKEGNCQLNLSAVNKMTQMFLKLFIGEKKITWRQKLSLEIHNLFRFKCEVPCTRESEVVSQQNRDVAPSLEALEKEVVAQPKRPAIRPGRRGVNGRKTHNKKEEAQKKNKQ